VSDDHEGPTPVPTPDPEETQEQTETDERRTRRQPARRDGQTEDPWQDEARKRSRWEDEETITES
jgi:hypothetical protein